jgi:flagellar motor switch protein FliM
MTGTPSPSPLERKIAARRPRSPAEGQSVGAGLERGMAVAAEKLARMPLRMLSLSQTDRSAGEIVDTLPEQALIVLIGGPAGASGLVIVSGDAVACLIEILTLGRLSPRAPVQRRPTRTDAALLAEYIDHALAEVDACLAGSESIAWAGGFRCTGHLEDPRPLKLMLEEPDYRAVRCRIGFGPPATAGEGRTGEITFVFPAAGRGEVPRPLPDEPAAARDEAPHGASEHWQGQLDTVLSGAQVQLDAILARVNLPLAAVLGLTPGMLLPLPKSVLQQVQLEGANGSLVCHAQLGQGNGQRALRLSLAEGDDPVPLALPAIEGEAIAAEAPPGIRPLPAIPEPIARAAEAEARAAETRADQVMEAALAQPERA